MEVRIEKTVTEAKPKHETVIKETDDKVERTDVERSAGHTTIRETKIEK